MLYFTHTNEVIKKKVFPVNFQRVKGLILFLD